MFLPLLLLLPACLADSPDHYSVSPDHYSPPYYNFQYGVQVNRYRGVKK